MTFDEVMNYCDLYPSLINQEAKTLSILGLRGTCQGPFIKVFKYSKKTYFVFRIKQISFKIEEKQKRRKINDQYEGPILDNLNKLFFQEIKKPLKVKIEKAKEGQLITESWIKKFNYPCTSIPKYRKARYKKTKMAIK